MDDQRIDNLLATCFFFLVAGALYAVVYSIDILTTVFVLGIGVVFLFAILVPLTTRMWKITKWFSTGLFIGVLLSWLIEAPAFEALMLMGISGVVLILIELILAWLIPPDPVVQRFNQEPRRDERPPLPVGPPVREVDRSQQRTPTPDEVSREEYPEFDLPGPPLEILAVTIIARGTGTDGVPYLRRTQYVYTDEEGFRPYANFRIGVKELWGKTARFKFTLTAPGPRWQPTKWEWSTEREITPHPIEIYPPDEEIEITGSRHQEGEWKLEVDIIATDGNSRTLTTSTFVLKERPAPPETNRILAEEGAFQPGAATEIERVVRETGPVPVEDLLSDL